MVTYIRSDLDFILKQIQISEAHAAGQPLYGPGGLIPSYNLSWGLRTVDGSYNNLLPGREEWGAADNPFPEGLGTDFRPGEDFDMNGPAPGGVVSTNYDPSNDPNSIVVDSSLRTISNLIVDQTLGNPAAILSAMQRAGIVAPDQQMAVVGQISAAYTPLRPLFEAVAEAEREYAVAAAAAAASPSRTDLQEAKDEAEAELVAARAALDSEDDDLVALLEDSGIEMDGANVSLSNVAPDVGLSAPFNSWFTLFGQFFDHGLDLVGKGGSGTVFIPLKPDDPLYDPTSSTNFMVLTRATVLPGADNIMGTADDVRPVNTTTSFVDQNQTYTSHASHQVFLRQYALNGDGKPVATGKLIEGEGGGMANWAEVKAQALMLGIKLEDRDVGNVPLLRTDQYGKFIPNQDGYAQVIVGVGDDGIPNTADDDVVSGTPQNPVVPSDVFAIRTGHAFLADIAHDAVPDGLADGDIEIGLNNPGFDPGDYDNELLDAHFIAGDGRANENIGLTAVHHVFHSEHNRLVEHTKAVALEDAQAMLAGGATQAEAVAFLNEWLAVDVAAVPTSLNGLVWDGDRLFQAAKFGTEMQYQHLVFEEFARKIQPNINVFLVPDGYDATINPSIVAEFAHVVYRFGHSMLTESIDRFDPAFNQQHIGLIEGFLNPMQFENNGTSSDVDDQVAAGAIIRGMTRQVGNGIDEFVTSALRNNLLGLPLDLATINLARGRDTGVPSLNAARREFYDVTNNAAELKPYDSWVDFAGNLKNEASIINFVAAYGTHELITSQTTAQGKRDAAMTIITGVSVGGLEVPDDSTDFLNATGAYAGGTLGGLENVDLWIGGLAEKTMPFGGMLGSTFNFVFEVQMESLQNGDRFYYLQRLDGLHLFGEMEGNSFAAMIMRNTDATHLPSDVFSAPGLILEVDRTKQYNEGLGDADPIGGTILTPLVIRNNPATPGTDTNYLRYTGADHVLLGGTEANDILTASEGDDTLYGDGGKDRLEGGFGNDIINGGAGDDIITDIGGDENIKAGDGNDVVNAGPGLDLVLAGRGKDFILLGTDMGSEVFGGEGDDFILGNKNAERILGNEGSDWLETGTFDGAPGDNFDEIFAQDGIKGHDVFLGDGGFDEFIGEGGDDIMVGSPGRGKMIGMSGFDWTTYKDNTFGIDADLTRAVVFDENPTPPPNSALDQFEAIEGLSGTKFNDLLTGSDEDSTTLPLQGFRGSALDAQGIALVTGLQAVLGAGVTSFDGGDIILGGDGNDTITGRAGDDIIDGDKWLNVRISVRENSNGTGAEIASANSMKELVTKMFDGTYNPGQLVIQREILAADGTGDIDTAVYQGNANEYDITANSDGTFTIAHARGTQVDGTDTLRNVERAQFLDGTMVLTANTAAVGAPLISDQSPTEGSQLTASVGSIEDANGFNPANVQFQWQALVGTTWTNVATGATFTPNQARVNQQLRVVANFTDNNGNAETRTSLATDVVGDLYVGNANNNTFNGNAGADDASGAGGNDTLNGNAGDDILRGQAGVDTLNGGDGNDTLSGGAGGDTLNGGLGIDAMAGDDGNDVYIVDNSSDDVTEAAGGGTDRVETTLLSYILDANVENLTFTGTGSFEGTGNGLANVIRGAAGNDILDGGGAADTLIGGGGNDTYRVDSGNDTVTEAAGGGTDTIEFSNLAYTARANTEVLKYVGTGNATLTGTDAVNSLIGNVGNETMNGLGGADTLEGGDGADTMNGGEGADTMNGGVGADTMNGGGGNDTMNGGEGADTMNGGGGNDIFVFVTGSGADTIANFDANPTGGQDRLDISGLGVTAADFAAEVVISASGANTLITIGGDTITLLNTNPNAVTQTDFIFG